MNQASSSAPTLAESSLLVSNLPAKVWPSFCLATGHKFHTFEASCVLQPSRTNFEHSGDCVFNKGPVYK